MAEESVIDIVSTITEFNDMAKEMGDPDLDAALALVVRLIGSQPTSSVKASTLIVRLQALSAKFKMQATYYKVMDVGRSGSTQYKKKNIYYAASDSLDKLVDSLKYVARYGPGA